MTAEEWKKENPFEKLVKQHEKYFHTVAVSFKKLECYEDILQEIKIGFWESYIKYDPNRGSFMPGFATPRVRYSCLNYLTRFSHLIKPQQYNKDESGKMKYEKVISGNSINLITEEEIFDSMTNGDDLLSQINDKINNERLLILIKKLKPKDKKFMELKISGLNDVAIGKQMGISKQRCGQIKIKCLKKLKELLSESTYL